MEIKQLQINVNSGGYIDLQPILGVSKINLNTGDTYSIRVKAIDNNWYHTKTLTYNSKLQNNSFTIDGIITPANLLIGDGVESAVFYNVNGWPAIKIGCFAGAAGYMGLVCEFDRNQHGVGEYFGTGGGITTFVGGGTAYLSSDIIIGTQARIDITAYFFYTKVRWWNDKDDIGYANLGGVGVGTATGYGTFKE